MIRNQTFLDHLCHILSTLGQFKCLLMKFLFRVHHHIKLQVRGAECIPHFPCSHEEWLQWAFSLSQDIPCPTRGWHTISGKICIYLISNGKHTHSEYVVRLGKWSRKFGSFKEREKLLLCPLNYIKSRKWKYQLMFKKIMVLRNLFISFTIQEVHRMWIDMIFQCFSLKSKNSIESLTEEF